ncbi:MAG: hypothetical protein M3N19_06200 [Candidatus Eremiobacteraeota bacterium]|nr:hypothetical protein [Candidatus Eremiobacteraeota bacterium]
MPLPQFPDGINTELRNKPIPIKRARPKKPRDPRRLFVYAFAAVMLLVIAYPALHDLLRP